ncbi:GlxA family transcriptional regulator [Pseudomonas putida]|uniref:GlxA family transcriptional regulator n=1 Tax=Pseudomonas putida TaxID=303 RepID=UPI003F3138BC
MIDIVIYPEFKSFEAIGPMTVFTYANKHLQAQGKAPGYDVRIAAERLGPVISDTAMSLLAQRPLLDDELPHSVLLVGAHEIERIVDEQPALVDWTRRVAPKVERFAALCSGAFFLAASGLLHNKRATTHWRMAGTLQQKYPSIDVDSDSIFIQQGNLWTSAGVSASVDLALAFVEADFGHDLALQVAQDLVIFLKRPGGQSQFSANLTSQMTQASDMRAVQAWVLDNLDQKICIASMAEQAAVSSRHFRRVFSREVGMSPMEFVERARIDKARRLLSESELPMKSVAFKCGFATTDQMRIGFRKFLGVTPKEYRERFVGAAAQ